MKKNETITIRVEKKVKDQLTKIASDKKRGLSDFLRLLLTEIIEKKIKIENLEFCGCERKEHNT